ncbi:hypothetical protein [Microbispora sp. KK1-11]|uniref:hypothetical protein n=1 Tax=Microbispora sp. KK1-11 TaxID=2053005 RepID=UPI0011572DD9|nr:hypothetical protein [Microbispora sp. KK1-11]TQS29151.1 hypothetical protein FLW16_12480 [Microbispora sp. KK1-11]
MNAETRAMTTRIIRQHLEVAGQHLGHARQQLELLHDTEGYADALTELEETRAALLSTDRAAADIAKEQA